MIQERTVRRYVPSLGITVIYEVRDHLDRPSELMCEVKGPDGRWHAYPEGGDFPTNTRIDSPTLADLLREERFVG